MAWRMFVAKPLPESKQIHADLLPIGPLRINFDGIWIKQPQFFFWEYEFKHAIYKMPDIFSTMKPHCPPVLTDLSSLWMSYHDIALVSL